MRVIVDALPIPIFNRLAGYAYNAYWAGIFGGAIDFNSSFLGKVKPAIGPA